MKPSRPVAITVRLWLTYVVPSRGRRRTSQSGGLTAKAASIGDWPSPWVLRCSSDIVDPREPFQFECVLRRVAGLIVIEVDVDRTERGAPFADTLGPAAQLL